MRSVVWLLAVAAALAVHLPHALAQTKSGPMIFALAHGAANECGPGCSEWIAAEGEFRNPNLAKEFLGLLETLNGRKPPVVFNSLGGMIGQAMALGRLLREHRMTVTVGETYPEGCRASIAADPACRKILPANREIKARLRPASGECSSACVLAFLGGSVRRVPEGARIGVHAATPTPESNRPGSLSIEQLTASRKVYVLMMGADPGLVDTAEKTPAHRIHRLNRAELAQYGIETRDPFETTWLTYIPPERADQPSIVKAITATRGPKDDEPRTTKVRIACIGTQPGTGIVYHREPASDEIKIATTIRVAVGNDVRILRRHETRRGDDFFEAVVDRQFVRKAIAAGSIVFSETFSSASGQSWSRQVSFSAKGLEQALDTPLEYCGAT
jgi:hypothetical protein